MPTVQEQTPVYELIHGAATLKDTAIGGRKLMTTSMLFGE